MKNKHTVPSEIDPTIELITPVVAKKILEGNTSNRKLRKSRVAQYADAMKRGQWEISPDAITISKTGQLLNGQHRLNAIIASGESCQLLILRGVENEVFTIIDAGLSRSVNDALMFSGLGVNATHSSPIVKALIAIDAGINIYDTNAYALVQRQDVVDYVKNNGEMVTWALNLARKAELAVGGIRTAWGVFVVLAAQKHGSAKVEEFVTLVTEGVGLKPGDSPLALRNWITRQRGSWARTASKTNIAIYISSFNKWMDNEKVSVVRPSGTTWETFPEVID